MEIAFGIIYALGFLYVFLSEFFEYGDRFLPALLKGLFWWAWVVVLFLNRPPRDI